MATEPAKPRVWTADEIKLLIELAQLKTSAPSIAKLPSVPNRAENAANFSGPDGIGAGPCAPASR